ncbi:DUF6933 domain-containing protein [Companilactobacillus ginsenosidimutans]|uniref:DUF6933 domain-containing protein n=1 Tax=Companilactobacillus ginsenosidimutans TaxID=1007676 RepID=UPI000660A1CC|nr:hypothetical protein [Companilactobacillus ginsenosidimutans]
MFIKPTKKSNKIFKQLPKVSVNDDSEINPLFAWHANYLPVDRKNLVFLTNDLSYVTIVLANVNADKQHHLQKEFHDALFQLCDDLFIPNENFEKYVKQGGKLEFLENGPVNRNAIGAMNNAIRTGGGDIYQDVTYQQELSMVLSKLLIKYPDNSRDTPDKKFAEALDKL